MKPENLRFRDFKWEDKKLFVGKDKTGFEIIQLELYKIKFPDGELSKDFYNLTRAKDNAVRKAMDLLEQDAPKTAS